MSICVARFRETVTPSNALMSLMSGKETLFQVPPKAFRLDGRVTQRIRHNWNINLINSSALSFYASNRKRSANNEKLSSSSSVNITSVAFHARTARLEH